jgi:cysteine desulfurase
MMPYFSEKFGNASSTQHAFGWDAEEAEELARDEVAALIKAKPTEILFTSGATESINLALFGYYEGNQSRGNHIITCKTEHKAVLDCCEKLQKKGAQITYLEVDKSGLIDLESLSNAFTDQTLIVAIMHANNETGVLQSMKEISSIAHEKGVPVFSDMTQSVGKLPVDMKQLGVDLAAFSSHKIYGPKGVGALYINSESKLKLEPQIVGGGHEKGYRSGTLNVPGIVGLGKACQLCENEQLEEVERLKALRDQLGKELKALGSIHVNGEKSERLPHVLNVSFSDIEGSKLMRSMKGLAVAQGSACNSSVIEPSHVLTAMGLSNALAYASLRISLGRFTTEEEISKATKIIRGAIEQLRMQLF